MTSRELADLTMKENQPYDYGWIKYVFRKEGYKGLKEIAKTTVDAFAPKDVTKQLIGRAATKVANELYNFAK